MLGFILDVIETSIQMGICVEISELERKRKSLEEEKQRIEKELQKIQQEKRGNKHGR